MIMILVAGMKIIHAMMIHRSHIKKKLNKMCLWCDDKENKN